MNSCMVARLLVLVMAGSMAAGGCAGSECSTAADCGPVGDALCLGGSCRLFGDNEYASAVVDVSFPRDMVAVPKSGRLHFLHPRLADGGTIDCAEIMAAPQLLADSRRNLLHAEPKMVVFNCCGTFFPNILVQLIRPAEGALAAGVGFSTSDATGEPSALGCTDGVPLSTGVQAELVLNMQAIP